MPYSSIRQARVAVSSLFKTGWDAQGGTIPKVGWDDVPFDIPTDGAPWAKFSMKHNKSNQATLGGVNSRRFRKVGIISVEIFSRYGSGLTLADQYAKVAVDIFEGKKTDPDGVMFTDVTSKEVGQSGDWFQTNVTASFNYDIIK